jgi:hypothetical protein
MGGALEVLESAFQIILNWWWVILPIVFVFIWSDIRGYYKKQKELKKMEWALLQIAIPQEIIKTPLAMEQIFAGLHSIHIGKDVKEWFSLEICSVAGDIYIYIRTPSQYRNLVESHIYAQYPDAEIHKVDDYTKDIYDNIPDENYDIAGGEFKLSKKDPYPIRTWLDFKFETKDGEGDVDPIAGLVETLSKLKEGENFWLQFTIRPTGDDWKKEGEDIVSKLIGRKIKDDKKKSVLLEILRKEARDYAKGTLRAPFEIPVFDNDGDNKSETAPLSVLSPGERDVIEAIEKNIAKVGFDVDIRGIYIAHRDVFDKHAFITATSAFRQFGTQNLNAIELKGDPIPSRKGLFKARREHFEKKKLLSNYHFRFKSNKSFIFSIEELATIFHFPGKIVSSPTIQRIETKKGEPPIGLPMY